MDNPCVPNACFSMFKADGSEVAVAFQVENDDEAWPDFAKADQSDPGDEQLEPKPAEQPAATPATAQTPVEKAIASVITEPTSELVAARAEELAKAAANGTTWMDHIESARADLMKGDSPLSLAAEEERRKKEDGEQAPGEEAASEAEEPADEGADDEEAGDDDAASEKVTPAGVCQKWTASDGQLFDKKADAVAHEEALLKAAEPQTEAQKLAARLAKATGDEEPEVEAPLMDDFDRLGKVIQALETPFIDGAPKLEKGMYTVSRFANVLWDVGSLTRKIAAEGKKEGGDSEDAKVSDEMKTGLTTLANSFKTYVDDQITELLAGMDDDVCVSTYDYYCAAAKEDGENQLAKDICSVIDERREPSRERRDTLAKSFGYVEGELEVTDEDVLSPPMQKRFDALESENAELKKVAEDAVSQVEDLAKRVKAVEDTPLPRAPKNIALRPGDGTFFGKTANTDEEKTAVLHDLLKQKGPDALALELIKLSQGNPIHLNLKG